MFIKKIIAAAAAAVLALGVFTAFPESPAVITVSAEESYETKDGLVISTDENGVKYVSGWSREIIKKNVSIPNGVGYIKEYALYTAEHIESVTIPSSVTKIEPFAFVYCTNLKKVTFASNSKLNSIGNCAFVGCPKLTSINLPNSLKEIGTDAFLNCENLTSLTVPSKTKIANDSHFAGYMCGYLPGTPANDMVYIKADGKAEVYDMYIGESNIYDLNMSGTVDKELDIKQKPITLYVTKGSDAEKYAKNNGIAYKYGKAPSSSTKTSTSTTTKLAAPTGIKGTVSEEKITLKWNKVSGAKAYRVYKYNSKTGKYVKYKDVTGTTCTVTGLKAGTSYKFKVYALTSKNGKYVQQTASKVVSYKTKEYNTDYIA